jgi:hypothetical protein
VKLQLWETHLEQNNLTYFPSTGSCQDVDVDTCVEFICDIKSEFKNRFEQFKSYSQSFKMFFAPFDVDHQQVLDEFQLEMIELQCSDELKAKYLASNLLDLYRLQLLPSGKFSRVTKHALKVISMFGTTYRSEPYFCLCHLLNLWPLKPHIICLVAKKGW